MTDRGVFADVSPDFAPHASTQASQPAFYKAVRQFRTAGVISNVPI